jgi:anti-sigma regulatory factor (Ser/Thr protein kinase)
LTKINSGEFQNFIVSNVEGCPADIVTIAAQHFKVSRQAVHNRIRPLINAGILEMQGVKKNARYSLKNYEKHFTYNIIDCPAEDIVFTKFVRPALPGDISENILQICNYGFTEIFNNALDHSESQKISVIAGYNARNIKLYVLDDGVGIFNKIQKALDLEDPKFAILELAKGKLTTAPDKHSGEGIFFTSRVFDSFYITSGSLIFFGHRDKDLIVDDKSEVKGTAVTMTIHRDSKTTIKSVFDEYTSDAKDDYAFVRTVIPVKLMQYEGEALMSRSQAKRLIMRFERFREVVLNFDGVKTIGQAFADEIFRVFKAAHPEVNLMLENADDSILNMVNWVKKSSL